MMNVRIAQMLACFVPSSGIDSTARRRAVKSVVLGTAMAGWLGLATADERADRERSEREDRERRERQRQEWNRRDEEALQKERSRVQQRSQELHEWALEDLDRRRQQQQQPTLAAPSPGTAAAPTGAPGGGFAFLAEMPSVERVRREILGADAIDTRIQQYAAFHMLAMDFMLTQRGGAHRVPAAFTERDRAYKAEVIRLDRELRSEVTPPSMPAAERPQHWAPVFMKLNSYNGNAAFRKMLFKRFFSSAWVASYERNKIEFEKWRTSVNAQPAAPSGRPAPGR